MSFGKTIPFRRIEHARLGSRTIFKAYCPLCGIFIGASTDLQLVGLAERAHNCQRFDSRTNRDRNGT